MLSLSLLTGLVAALPLISATPVPVPIPSLPVTNHTLAARAPQWFEGPWWNFPPMSAWLGFDDLFGRNIPSMRAMGSTWDDIGRINVAIRECAKLGVDERVILAIIMQESHGDVGAPTTYSPDGLPTAGIMQCWNCPGFPRQYGLSQEQITSMIRGGTQHFKRDLVIEGDGWLAEDIYPALRRYNSGNVNYDNLSDGRGATASYVSDIAQRLTGWTD
ncbi:hypothetical protein QBC34DRAFT_479519 [Podospora aff. communis PSN243]|uniref:Glycoside Hydrolase Family 23 n=1 Tax=Podospora aff. communis PSN243 TaxID=3040156 RepID=A0AAV9G1Y8_9PEZI|nr:hypothetical protein QBC34DRAFT_479519 [Podospora aff. communis PSN243]